MRRPVVILGAPRSGTTLLFELLANAPNAWTVGRESHRIIESIPALMPMQGVDSNRLGEADASADIVTAIQCAFMAALRNRDEDLLVESPPHADKALILEKTPRNTLRIPFMRAVFPHCRFIYLYRDARENIASLIEGWQSGRFCSYRFKEHSWSFLLPPGWEEMVGRPVAEIAAFQWRTANEYCLDDLAAIDANDWCAISYSNLVGDPATELRNLCAFAELDFDSRMESFGPDSLPPSTSTLTPPRTGKWLAHEESLQTVLPSVAAVSERLAGLKARRLLRGGSS